LGGGSNGGAAGQTQQGVLGALMGLINPGTPGGDVLGPLSAQFRQNLDYGLSAMNASAPGRFSTANNFTQGQFTQRSLNDYNVLAQQSLEQGRNRQLQAIMELLGPVMSPTFGGPFTQDASGFENFLGFLNTASGFIPFGGDRDSGGGGGGGGVMGGVPPATTTLGPR
jgi:hypothetical protein